MIQLNDNSIVPVEYEDNPIVKELLNRDISDLEKENFLIFPSTYKDSIDLGEDSMIFSEQNRVVSTRNIIGFLSKTNNEIQINSRFYDNHKSNQDYFIQYLLEKVLNINVTNQKIKNEKYNGDYDLFVYLFPSYLNEALKKGMYKEYVTKKHNDYNIKGPFSVNTHIKKNTPFLGKISYTTREFSYDNSVIQLIRHTIEKINSKYNIENIKSEEYRENIKAIIRATPKYSRFDRNGILNKNIATPIKHGYFEEYLSLQKLCISIINEKLTSFGDNDDQIHGIIIDVAWLWEEYLDTILSDGFVHSNNKERKNPIYFYKTKKNPRYPDFYNKDVILDAKYKRLDKSTNGGISREDLYQMTSYLHVHKAKTVGLIYPSINKTDLRVLGELEGFGGEVFKIGLEIPQDIENYKEFTKLMILNEEKMLTYLNEYMESK